MNRFSRRFRSLATGALFLALAAASAARATEYNVPAPFATLQDAVTAAEGSVQPDNYININAPLIGTNAVVTIDDSFDATRKLTIRPGPTSGLTRATIASSNGSEPILSFSDAGYVTLHDLDIVRNSTNNDHLILMEYGVEGNDHITLDRCRIGSIWTTVGGPGWACLSISQPTEILVRNCIFFAYAAGTLDHGIDVYNFFDPANSIRLYNNVVADFRLYGIGIEDGLGGTFLVLRNNIVSSHPALAPEPTAYLSNVAAGVSVVSSHNAAFSSGAALTEAVLGAQSISMPGSPSFLLRPRVAVDPAFIERTWDLVPPWDPNADFFRLEVAGPMHAGPNGLGQTVGAGSPHGLDLAVLDDSEKDFRPSGAPLHTDRGADQIEKGTGAQTGVEPGLGDDHAAGEPAGAASSLWAAPRRNPARDVGVLYRVAQGGRLTFELADLSGRMLYATERQVGAGETGAFEWAGTRFSGPVAYRLRLSPAVGRASQASGTLVLIK